MPENIFILDTSAFIEILRPGGSKDAQNYIRNLINENRIATTRIIEVGLLGGANSQKEYKELQDNCPVIHFDKHFDFISKHSSWDDRKIPV